MAFDFKKEYKEFYMPKNKPEIVTVPKANYIAVRGKGNPNEEGGTYQQAISVLYAVAYTLKMSYKTDYKIEGFFEYVVPPLEGFAFRTRNISDYPFKNFFYVQAYLCRYSRGIKGRDTNNIFYFVANSVGVSRWQIYLIYYWQDFQIVFHC